MAQSIDINRYPCLPLEAVAWIGKWTVACPPSVISSEMLDKKLLKRGTESLLLPFTPSQKALGHLSGHYCLLMEPVTVLDTL